MRVGFWAYPSLFQSSGGLQNQIVETANALREQGCVVKNLNFLEDSPLDFDVVHIFSAAHGNHTVARFLKNKGVPFVVSPVLQSYWTPAFGKFSKGSSWLVGFASRWRMRTEYDHYKSCLSLSNHVIALGEREKLALRNCFEIPEDKCDVIPNGIAPRFFSGNKNLFLENYTLEAGFVLCVGLIGEWKNQAMVVTAAREMGRQVVLIGACKKEDQKYLIKLKEYPKLNYIGVLPYESELLASAYAAAGVLCLPSISEVMPMCVLESLASGTPAVVTRNNSMDLRSPGLYLVDPASQVDVIGAIEKAFRSGIPRNQIADGVASLSWQNVASKIIEVYKKCGV